MKAKPWEAEINIAKVSYLEFDEWNWTIWWSGVTEGSVSHRVPPHYKTPSGARAAARRVMKRLNLVEKAK